jgi:hypothetical protein
LQVTEAHVQAPVACEQLPVEPALQLALFWHLQTPPSHAKPGGQARPQAPQLAASVSSGLQPVGVSQQVWPRGQAGPPLQLHVDCGPWVLQPSPGMQVKLPQEQMPVCVSQVALAPPIEQSALVLQPHWLGVAAPQVRPPA